MSEDLARALERRAERARQVAVAATAALLVLAARHASPDLLVVMPAGGRPSSLGRVRITLAV